MVEQAIVTEKARTWIRRIRAFRGIAEHRVDGLERSFRKCDSRHEILESPVFMRVRRTSAVCAASSNSKNCCGLSKHPAEDCPARARIRFEMTLTAAQG